MRSLSVWCGLAAALLCGLADPAWGFAAVCMLSLVQIALLGRPTESLFLLVHYTTVLVYFSIAPSMQISADVGFWGGGPVGPQAYTQTLVLLLLYLAGVEAASLVFARTATSLTVLSQQPPDVKHPTLLLVLVCAGFAVLWVRPELNFVARGTTTDIPPPPFDTIVFSTLPKLVVLVGTVALSIRALRKGSAGAWCAVATAVVLAAIAANPVNTARQILLVGMLPLLLHAFGRHWRWTLALVITSAVAGLGPVLNLISRGSMWGETLAVFPYSADFDSTYVVSTLLERAPPTELGWGRYLLSAVSFLLPRDLKLFPEYDPLGWPSVLNNFSQSNLSLAPFTTAYLDFGLAGPFLLGLLLSAGALHLERRLVPNSALTGGYLSALVLLAAYVPLMRGPILGWGPFAASGLIAALAVGLLCAGGRHLPPRVERPIDAVAGA